eukprot:6156-Heterococcus_DN1.PRE.9
MTRPTRADRNAEKVSRQTARRVKRVTEGRWNFAKAVAECEHRKFIPHADAEAHWNLQTIRASQRKMLMADNPAIAVNDIMNGNTSAVKRTAAEKAASHAKCAATHKERGYGQQNWMESAAYTAAFRTLDPDGLLDIMPVLDGLGADLLIRVKGTGPWAPVQVKSAIVHYDEQTIYSIKQEDGADKYKGMIILAVGIDLATDCVAETVDHVPDVTVKDLFLYNSASDIPGASLQPYPRRIANDKYGDSRYVVGFDSDERFTRMQQAFHQYVRDNAKWTQDQTWFSKELNFDIEKYTHYQETLNLQTLARIVGIDKLRAPLRQNETTDIVMLIHGQEVNISVKSATIHEKGYMFKLSEHPNVHLCQVVMAFYRSTDGKRTHVSIMCPRRVYYVDKTAFYWSHTNNKDVLKERICLQSERAIEHISKEIKAVLSI